MSINHHGSPNPFAYSKLESIVVVWQNFHSTADVGDGWWYVSKYHRTFLEDTVLHDYHSMKIKILLVLAIDKSPIHIVRWSIMDGDLLVIILI